MSTTRRKFLSVLGLSVGAGAVSVLPAEEPTLPNVSSNEYGLTDEEWELYQAFIRRPKKSWMYDTEAQLRQRARMDVRNLRDRRNSSR